jgi:hypothetical protein
MSKNGKEVYIPEVPPFGTTILFGKKGAGKTLAAINSPWEPVHVVDVEGSSSDYFKEQKKLLEMGILKHGFTRADCPTYAQFNAEMTRLSSNKQMYGTLVIDTGGQWAEWSRDKVFAENSSIVDKQSQVVWGKLRDKLRGGTLFLASRAKLVIVTAHEREFKGVITPRLNPAIIELAAMSWRLVRDPNKSLPDGYLSGARLPYFPPRMQAFTVANLLQFFDAPADWNNLSEGERQPELAMALPGAMMPDEEYDG